MWLRELSEILCMEKLRYKNAGRRAIFDKVWEPVLKYLKDLREANVTIWTISQDNSVMIVTISRSFFLLCYSYHLLSDSWLLLSSCCCRCPVNFQLIAHFCVLYFCCCCFATVPRLCRNPPNCHFQSIYVWYCCCVFFSFSLFTLYFSSVYYKKHLKLWLLRK